MGPHSGCKEVLFCFVLGGVMRQLRDAWDAGVSKKSG